MVDAPPVTQDLDRLAQSAKPERVGVLSNKRRSAGKRRFRGDEERQGGWKRERAQRDGQRTGPAALVELIEWHIASGRVKSAQASATR